MIKEDIILQIAQELSIPNYRAKILLADLLEFLEKTILKEKKLLLQKFGTFEIKKREKTIGRNIKTMEEVIIPARERLYFHSSKSLKNLVNKK